VIRVHIKSKFINEGGVVGRSRYADGSPALLFSPDSGEPAYALSTNLAGHNITVPAEGHVYIKGYAEHEGLCEALVKLGVVEAVQEITLGPYDTKATLVKVLV